MKFLDVKTDIAFKKVFGAEESKGILISFLNAMIKFADGSRITDLTIVDSDRIPLLKGMKDSYITAKAVLSNQARIIVEVQVLFEGDLEKDVLHNAAKNCSTQLKKAGTYPGSEAVIALTITDFIIFKEIGPATTFFKLEDKETLIDYDHDVELIFAELPKSKKSVYELTTIADKWLFFIQNAGNLEHVPRTITVPEIQKAFDIANIAALNEEEYEIQFKGKDFIHIQKSAFEKAKEDNFKKGFARGRIEAINEIAGKMLSKELEIALISDVTGLSETVILKLRCET